MVTDAEQIAQIIARRTEGSEGNILAEARKLGEYGFSRESILKTLGLKYDDTGNKTLFDVPGVDVVRAAALIEEGYETPRRVANASSDEIERLEYIGSDTGRAIVETSAVLLDESPTLNRLRKETDYTDRDLVDLLRPIAAAGIPPSDAVDDLVSVLTKQPSIVDELDLDGRTAYNLERGGLGSIDDIAASSLDGLTAHDYVGKRTAERVREAAREHSDTWDNEDEPDSRRGGRADPEPIADDRDGGQPSTTDRSEHDDEEDGKSPEFELRLLLVGSSRPNLEDGENAGVRIRAALESEGHGLDEFDAVVYTGFVPPSPHHESFQPGGCFEELTDQLHALASQVPLYFITGDYGEGDPLDNVYERRSYAPEASYDPFTTAPNDLMTYVPIQDTVPLGMIKVTQNPTIADAVDDCLLVAPDLYPELWNDHDALAYVAGGQLPGRLIDDSIAPSYAMENVGPKRPDSAGAVHGITVTDDGIESHDLIPLGDVTMISCPDHINRGLQFAHEGSGCMFCLNEDRFFEEWLRAGTRKHRMEDREGELGAALDGITERGYFTPEQAEEFRTYAGRRIYEDHLGQAPRTPTIGAKRAADSDLISDPRDIYDEATLIASDQVGIEPHDRAGYFHRFAVDTPAEIRNRAFQEVRPPLPEELSEGHAELDQAAYDRNEFVGEWLFFPKRQVVGQVWRDVLKLVGEGLLYDAQVSTAWHHQARTDRSKRYFLGAAAPTYFDVNDVHRIGRLLIDEGVLGPDEVFTFKPILYTKLGIHKHNSSSYGIDSPSRFTMRILDGLTDE